MAIKFKPNAAKTDFEITTPGDETQPVGSSLRAALSKSITIENPTGSEDLSMFFTNKSITITEIRAALRGSATPSVTMTIRHGTDRNAVGAEVVTGGSVITSITTGLDITSFNNPTVVADSFVWLETIAQSGTVLELQVTILYKKT